MRQRLTPYTRTELSLPGLHGSLQKCRMLFPHRHIFLKHAAHCAAGLSSLDDPGSDGHMKTRFRLHIRDVFSDGPFGGKPVVVFPRAVGLSARLMKHIAGELNRHKTACVFPAETEYGSQRLRTISNTWQIEQGIASP